MQEDSCIILKTRTRRQAERCTALPCVDGWFPKSKYSHSPLAAREGGNVHEAAQKSVFPASFYRALLHYAPAVVEHPLLSTALRHLLLLLLFDLGGLRLDLAGTGERAVNYKQPRISQARRRDDQYRRREGRAEDEQPFPMFACCGLEVDADGE